MNNISLRALTKEDWRIYKTLRLQSLSDSPDSFGATLASEQALNDDEWSARLDYSVRGMHGVLFIALLNNNPIGLACSVTHSRTSQDGHIYQMWISPKARGLGIGHQLLTHIINWAKNEKLKRLSLAVTTTNIVALKLYQALGFRADGDLVELRAGSKLQTQPMILDLYETQDKS